MHGGGAPYLSGVGYHREALEAGVRIVAVSRPGSAGSTMHAGFSVAGFHRDVAELADQLAIDRFVVMGNSNGGMFALAVGHALPERVIGVLPLNPATPVFDDPQALELTPVYNDLQAIGVDGWVAGMRESVRAGLADHSLLRAPPLFQFSESTEEEVIDLYLLATQLVQPGTLECEAGLLLESWGFDLFDIRPPVVFISGQSEVGTPYNRYWSSRLPAARIEEPPGGHMSHLAPDQRRNLMQRVIEFHKTADTAHAPH
jgi:pimeloyl-ACP methyl ester carboxylesterase